MTIAPLLAPVPVYARGENFTTTPPSLTLWTLRSNDADSNEKVKKNNRLNKQNNNFARAPHFFVNFLPVFARLRHENALFRVYGGRKQATTKFYFSFWAWIEKRSLEIQLWEGSPTFDKVSG